MSDFSERLRQARTSRGMSRDALAGMLGVSATAVYKWECAASEPGIDTLRRLADIFGLSMDELMGHQPPEEGDIAVFSRAMRQLSDEEREQLLRIGRALFSHAFEEPAP